MIKPYVSKRRKLVHANEINGQPRNDDDSNCTSSCITHDTWQESSICDYFTDAIQSFANEISWSQDGLYLVLGTLKGDLFMVYPGKSKDNAGILKLKTIQSVPRAISWDSKNANICFASYHGFHYNMNIMTGKLIDHKQVTDVNNIYCGSHWNEYIILGCKNLYLVLNSTVVKVFGPSESLVSCMLVIEDILFVAYDYSQTSSSDKSIIAFTLPSGAPISNKLTDCLYSYTCLRYSHPYVYGMTSNGQLSRFFARSPFKMDKAFDVKFSELPCGYSSKFDIKDGVIVYGNNKGQLVSERIPECKKGIPRPKQSPRYMGYKSESPIVNVRFHPKYNYVAVSKWDGRFGILNL